jgi:hypothetical protein
MPQDYRPTPPHDHTTTLPCPGWHNDAWRYEETDDPEHDRAGFIPGDPVWCGWCADATRSSLRYLPRLAAGLVLEVQNATDPKSEFVSGSRTRALHPHQAQALLIHEIYDTLTQWEDLTRERRAFTPRRTDIRQGAAIGNASAFLLAHLDWILQYQPESEHAPAGDVRAFVDRVHHLDRRAMRLTHKVEAVAEECVGVRCNNVNCSQMALVRAVDQSGAHAGGTVCQNCGTRMSPKEYQQWTGQWAAHDYAALSDGEQANLGAPGAAYERVRPRARSGA